MLRSRKNQKIHVFCPPAFERKVQDVLERSQLTYELNSYCMQDGVPAVVCHYRSYALNDEQKSFLIEAMELGAWVEPLISYLDNLLGYTEIDLIDSSFFLHQKAFSILSNPRPKYTKRVLDIITSSIGLFTLLPLFALTAVVIKLESKGPIFYKQKRVGLFNKEFEVIKFRSMRADAEAHGAQWATKDDARITRVGRFIRKTRIDELPQLINVLKGEMSLIGPRPEREVFIKDLEKNIPFYRFRHAVKPGISGLAQVKYPYGASIEDAQWKHRYDLHYIKHQTLLVDLRISLATIKTILFAKGQ